MINLETKNNIKNIPNLKEPSVPQGKVPKNLLPDGSFNFRMSNKENNNE